MKIDIFGLTIEELINDIRKKMDIECRYYQWMADNSFERADKIANNTSAKHCAAVVAACELELDRILNNAVRKHCGGAADGN